MTDRITIAVYRTRAERAIQVQISQTDENGNGTGYRLAGPKHYNAGVTELLTHELDARDAAEIRGYLDAVFPNPAVERLRRIAEAHQQQVTDGGMTSGECAECGYSWPCPTRTWATTDRDPLATWDPADDEPEAA